jgi:release factor glutamine methyltransferase
MTVEGTVAWRALLREATERLETLGAHDPANEARLIVERASGAEGAGLVVVLDEPATQRGVAHFDRMLERRAAGEPLQYVLGAWGFRALDLFVDRRVLIPRPETEVVVDHALAVLDERRPSREGNLLAVDLGTGSGAIALSLAFERERVDVWATDVSDDALDVARANLGGLGRAAARVRLVAGAWFDALPRDLAGSADLVVSNPPYVAADEPLPTEVESWEPAGALRAGPSGTEALDAIVDAAMAWLSPGGGLVLELAPHQAEATARRARLRGYVDVRVFPDLTGRERALVARAPTATT